VTWIDPEEISFRYSSYGLLEKGGPNNAANALVKGTISFMNANYYALEAVMV